MFADGTHISSFVSKLVQEKCKPKLDVSSSINDLDKNSQTDRPLRRGNGIANSTMSLGVQRNGLQYRSQKSLNSGGGSNNILNDDLEESAIFEIENMDFLDYEDYQGVCVMIELPNYTNLIQSLADRGSVSTQMIARSVEVYLSKVTME
jgi:hypothetical protein